MYVSLLTLGGSAVMGVFSTLGHWVLLVTMDGSGLALGFTLRGVVSLSCRVGCDCLVVAVLKNSANCFSALWCLDVSERYGAEGAGSFRAAMRSLAACAASSSVDNLGMLQCMGKHSAVPAIQVDLVDSM
eukprot:14608529-Ditylum_brightwellii.AAC.1